MNQALSTPNLVDRPYSRLGFDLIFEIPLALLSLIWFKLVKFVVAILYGLSLALNRKILNQWHVFSDQTLKIPTVLPVVMTQGPRWNPHAVVVSVGPFSIEKEFSIDLNALKRSALSWTVVVYRYPSYQTISYISALEHPTVEGSSPNASSSSEQHSNADQIPSEWHTLSCNSGLYCLGVRLFGAEKTLHLPEVKVDGEVGIMAKEAPMVTPTYHNLKDKHGWFYLSLHYYVFTLLRLRPWLPESFIRQEYLPVGNPDTTFLYDYLRQGDVLCLQIPSLFLDHYFIYLTTYTRSSLPLAYDTIQDQTYTIAPMAQDGFYLIRVRPKSKQSPPIDKSFINLTVQKS